MISGRPVSFSTAAYSSRRNVSKPILPFGSLGRFSSSILTAFQDAILSAALESRSPSRSLLGRALGSHSSIRTILCRRSVEPPSALRSPQQTARAPDQWAPCWGPFSITPYDLDLPPEAGPLRAGLLD